MKQREKHPVIRFSIEIAAMAVLVFTGMFIEKYMVGFLQLTVNPSDPADFTAKSVTLIPGVLSLTGATNTGMSFGQMSDQTAVLSVITAIAVFAGIVYLAYPSKRHIFIDITATLILAGGTENLLGRLINGYVVDYFEFTFVDFAIFNFPDCLITCGAFALMFYLIWDMINESKKAKNAGGDIEADE